MFDSTFSYTSTKPLPPNLPLDEAISTLHDFDTIIRFSPDCRGCRPIHPPANGAAKPEALPSNGCSQGETQYYEVEDGLPFIPKRLWSGGVRYNADFVPVEDGCDITVHAPGGFTSTNRWRIVREGAIPEGEAVGGDGRPPLQRLASKDLLHAEKVGAGWYVQITSDARCNRTFAGFVKCFLKNSHAQLELAFIEHLQAAPATRSRRPTLGRRRSSEF